jgi:divalent metal cation (Fe/Co/Zn/Cd) transporter
MSSSMWKILGLQKHSSLSYTDIRWAGDIPTVITSQIILFQLLQMGRRNLHELIWDSIFPQNLSTQYISRVVKETVNPVHYRQNCLFSVQNVYKDVHLW